MRGQSEAPPPPAVACVAEALAIAPGASLWLGARLVHWRDADRVGLLADATGSIAARWPARAPEPPRPGQWWLLRGVRVAGAEHALEAREARCEGSPAAPFPTPDGEWLRLHEEGARRARWLRERSALLRATRDFFAARGYLEVETPVGVYSPGVEPHLQAYAVNGRGRGEPRWLRTSPEYEMKRLLAAGLPRLFQLGPVFRREERGAWHEPEFTMLEWYRAFAGYEELMAETEQLVATLARQVSGRPVLRTPAGEVDVTPPWPRLSVEQAFARHAEADLWDVLRDEARFFELLALHVQPALGTGRAVFLVDWPAPMASLARLKPGDPRVAERFEAFAGGVELCNGFGELVDPEEQGRRFEHEVAERARLGLPEHPICERFLAALREGLPPCAGNALGFDRLVALLLGAPSVQDVRAVPAGRLDPERPAPHGSAGRSSA